MQSKAIQSINHCAHQVKTGCKRAYWACARQVSVIDTKVEDFFHAHLPRKVANVALPILRALPFALIWVPMALIPPSLWGMGVRLAVIIPIHIISHIHKSPKLHSALSLGFGVGSLSSGTLNTIYAIQTQRFGSFLPFAALDFFFASIQIVQGSFLAAKSARK